ncbi:MULTISPECIES: hypothetical protein [Streptomycetaceae]|uniref:hypothetical protein n=1 Tax=Streptomycetaceae TaxID=2062 RepID=UPI00093B71D4|nr:hypothetical protein [Streptomyces sp. CB02056]OKI00528.1 hypothetical protein AMK13_33135 [Streptomyces sp. CB02056]
MPVIDRPEQITLPLDGYKPTAEQAVTISRASHLVTARCMKDFGLQAPEETYDAFTQAATAARERTQLYGYFAPAKAAEKGYDRNQVIPDSTLSPDVTSVLYGADPSGKPVTSFNGRPVPKGGCWQAGADALGGPPPVPGTAQGLPDKGPRIPLTDPRLTAAYAEWSACMKGKGYSYANPADAYSDRKWGAAGTTPAAGTAPAAGTPPPRSPDEVPTAEADIACKLSLNTVGRLVAVETAYDNQYIARNADSLRSFAQQLSARTQRAQAVIAQDGATGQGAPPAVVQPG